MSIKDRPRLGRGLKGLLSQPVIVGQPAIEGENIPSTPLPDNGLQMVSLDLIDPNPHQPRQKIDPLTLAELVISVKASGILQPVLLRPVGDRYQLVAGHRRTEAAKKAGLNSIPAIIRADSTDESQAEWALIENIQREDLNAIERASAYRQYIDRFQLTHVQAAERLGEDRSVITNHLRLLELSDGVQSLIAGGLLSAGHAKVLAGVTDLDRQEALGFQAVKEDLSVRRLEEIVSGSVSGGESVEIEVGSHTRTLQAKSPHVVELEQDLSRKLGTKLRIFPARRKNSGKIVIQYFSLDEFDRIVEKIT